MAIVILGKPGSDKPSSINLTKQSAQPQGSAGFYFGIGCDRIGGAPVDQDLTFRVHGNGKEGNEVFAYFGNRFIPGVVLSEDNTTGDGADDDESGLVKVAELGSGVDKVTIAVALYGGPDFSHAENAFVRVCDGDHKDAPEIFRFPIDKAPAGSTLLHSGDLVKGADGTWEFKAVGVYTAVGQGQDAIMAAYNL